LGGRLAAFTQASAGGEPLWVVAKDLVIFFSVRGRPKMALNKRLPRITARDILSNDAFSEIDPLAGLKNLARVETFPGAACLTRFPVMHAP